ncbi:hypothetical protein GGER_35180 [Serratia rubidaea]
MHQRILRIEAGRGGTVQPLDLDMVKAVRLQVGLQVFNQPLPVGADHKTQLADRRGAGGDGIHRPLRIAGLVGQHFQRIPAVETLTGG